MITAFHWSPTSPCLPFTSPWSWWQSPSHDQLHHCDLWLHHHDVTSINNHIIIITNYTMITADNMCWLWSPTYIVMITTYITMIITSPTDRLHYHDHHLHNDHHLLLITIITYHYDHLHHHHDHHTRSLPTTSYSPPTSPWSPIEWFIPTSPLSPWHQFTNHCPRHHDQQGSRITTYIIMVPTNTIWSLPASPWSPPTSTHMITTYITMTHICIRKCWPFYSGANGC